MVVAGTERGNPRRRSQVGLVEGSGQERGPLLFTDGRTAWSFASSFFRSTDGGASFVKVAAPIPPGAGDVILLGAQPATDALTFVVADATVHSSFVLRFDTRSFQWTKQSLPIDPRHDLPGERGPAEVVTAGTFVPGDASGCVWASSVSHACG